MSDEVSIRVAIDLAAPSDPLGAFTSILADSLEAEGGFDVVRFDTQDRGAPIGSGPLARTLWRPLWRRGLGRRIDLLCGGADVVHVAGPALPPTKDAALVVSVDDLRPLRGEADGAARIRHLQRAARGGATIVATSRIASLEVQRVLELERETVLVVAPPVAWHEQVTGGQDVVVNLTGRVDDMVRLAPAMAEIANRHGSRVVVLASKHAQGRLREAGSPVETLARRRAGEALRSARVVVHLTDGARFPSFAVAAMAAGVPVCATATELNRELLGGAAAFAEDEGPDAVATLVADIVENEPRRAVMAAAGLARARDFAPEAAARAYGSLYRVVAAGAGQ